MSKVITTIIGGAIWGFAAYTIATAIGFEPAYASFIGLVALVSWQWSR